MRQEFAIPLVKVLVQTDTVIGGEGHVEALKKGVILDVEVNSWVAASAVSSVGAGLSD